MRFLLSVFFVLLLGSAIAQPTATIDRGEASDVVLSNLFALLDLSEVSNSTNLLQERGISWVDLDLLDGSTLSSDNLLEINSFGFAYSTFSSMAVQNGPALPDPLSTYVTLAEQLDRSADTIPIAMLFFDYHCLHKDAITNNLLAWNTDHSQLTDVANRPTSPYLLKKALAATSLVSEIKQSTDYNFVLSQSLFFSNKQPASSIEIDFNDGLGWRAVTIGQSITVNYPFEGKKEVIIKATEASGQYSLAHFLLHVNAKVDLSKSLLNKEEDEVIDIPATSQHSGGSLHILYNCDGILDKPLIVVDGLDPEAREDLGITEDDLRGVEFVIDLFRFLDPSSLSNTILDILEDNGYDLIFLDYKNGSDDMRRNAKMFQDALRLINGIKANNGSEERNVIAAPSMAGPVSKYGLLQMELAGEDHETEKVILLDATMRGGNVPLGIQHAIKQFHGLQGPWGTNIRNAVPALRHIRNIFEEPAFQQLFLHHAWSDNGVSPRQDHTDFYAELAAFGAPQHYEYVSLSAGSIRGTGQLYPPNGVLLDLELGTLGDLFNFLDAALSITTNLQTGALTALIAGTQVDITIRALPSLTTANIYNGYLSSLVLGSQFIIDYYSVNVTGTLPIDSAPGGVSGFNRASLPLTSSQVLFNTFCLVPTASSLDVPITLTNLTADYTATSNPVTQLDRFSGSTDATIVPPTYGGNTPEMGQENQEHNPIINNTNIGYLLYEITLQNTFDQTNGTLINRVFNFGETNEPFNTAGNVVSAKIRNIIDKTTLCSGANSAIWVNRNDKIAFIDEVNPQNRSNVFYQLFIEPDQSAFCDEETPDDVVVSFQNGGEMLVGEWSANAQNPTKVTVQENASVNVLAGGKIEMARNAVFTVKSGASMTIEAGGTLRLYHNATLIIEKGASLTIKSGANVQLWDGSDIDGDATIKVKGTLNMQEDILFSGNGYFHFFPSHSLNLSDNKLALEGEGQYHRFIELAPATVLDLGGADLTLRDGKVVYSDHSRIDLSGNNKIRLANTSHEGSSSATGIEAEAPRSLMITNSRFIGLGTGIDLYNFYPNPGVINKLISHCYFSGCNTGVFLDQGEQLLVSNSYFEQGIYAMLLSNVTSVRSNSNEITAYVDNGPALTSIPDKGAITLLDVPEFISSNDNIHANDVGIFVPENNPQDNSLNQSNIILRNHTVVSDHNNYGIYVAKGGIDENGLDYGLVLMDCAELLDNFHVSNQGEIISTQKIILEK